MFRVDRRGTRHAAAPEKQETLAHFYCAGSIMNCRWVLLSSSSSSSPLLMSGWIERNTPTLVDTVQTEGEKTTRVSLLLSLAQPAWATLTNTTLAPAPTDVHHLPDGSQKKKVSWCWFGACCPPSFPVNAGFSWTGSTF